MSQEQEIVQQIWARGYRVDPVGKVTNPNGNEVGLYRTPRGYWSFSVQYRLVDTVGKVETIRRSVNVHRFVAFALYGHKLWTPGLEVRHLDGNSDNNSWGNLALGTRRANERDKSPEVRIRVATQAGCARWKGIPAAERSRQMRAIGAKRKP